MNFPRFPITFDDGQVALGVRADPATDLPRALRAMGLTTGVPTIVPISSGSRPAQLSRLRALLEKVVVAVAEAVEATVASGVLSAFTAMTSPDPYPENGWLARVWPTAGADEDARSPPNTIAAVNSPTARVLKRCSFARGLPPESLTPIPPFVSVDLLKSRRRLVLALPSESP